MSQSMLRAWLLCALVLLPAQAYAAGNRWSFSLLLGGQAPYMPDLHEKLYQTPLMGNADILIREGGEGEGILDEDIDENETERHDFYFPLFVPAVEFGAFAGMEFQWHLSDRHAVLFGMGAWEQSTSNRASGRLPLQQYFAANLVDSERRDKISFTEYELGWRFNLISKPRFKLYSRLSIHEIFDIDFREDLAFLFVDSPIEDLIGIRRVMIVEAQIAAFLMGQVGAGIEWFISDNLSIGFEAGYLASENDFQLRNVRLRDDFNDGDNIYLTGSPLLELADKTLGYLVPDTQPGDLPSLRPELREPYYRPINLSFDGWRYLVRINIYY